MSALGDLMSRRVSWLALRRLPVPERTKAILGRWVVTWDRLRATRSPRANSTLGVCLAALSVAASFGIGDLVASQGRPSGSNPRAPATASLPGVATGTASVTPAAPPATSPSTMLPPAAPATTTAPSALTTLAAACGSIPSGSSPGRIVVRAAADGIQADPRSGKPIRWVGVTLAAPIGPPERRAAFSITAVLSDGNASLPSLTAPIDRAGIVQLWIFWDGTHLHKGVRTWDGRGWLMVQDADPAGESFTIALGGDQATMFWSGLQPGQHYGFITADQAGCVATALDANLSPTLTVRA